MRKIRRPARPNGKPVFFSLLAILLLAMFLGLASFLVREIYKKEPTQKGILIEGQQIATAQRDPYDSLDLRIAERAVYHGSPIQKIKNLGVENNVNRYIISFTVPEDNLTEYGLMTEPAAPRLPQGYPVIILCHGFTTPDDYSTENFYLNDMEFYSQHGFAVVKPDFRGQGLSLNDGQAEGAFYSMAYNTDLESLIASVKKTSYLNKDNISLWGHSMGAYIALRTAVLVPGIRNVILLSGPVGTAKDLFTSYFPSSDRANPVAEKIRQAILLKYGTPLTSPGFWAYTSPLNYLDKTSAVIQIHVGSLDRVVPPKFSADLDAALTAAGKPHEYYIYAGGNHGLVAERGFIWQRSLELLQESPNN